jgi:CHAT domain-containing protein
MVLATSFFCACSRRRDPQAEFDRTLQIFRRGDIRTASLKAEQGYAKFHSVSDEWAWKFRILQANALIWQGMPDPALSLLSSEPSPPTSGDLAVQKQRIEGVAFLASNHLAEAEQKIHAAEQLCSVSDSPACANVVLDRGSLEMGRGQFGKAEVFFERALALARERSNKFLEASSLLALSHSGIEQEHFDEAMDWAQASYRLAIEFGFQDIAQNALGNLGWDYYKLGESDRAQQFFLDAEAQATQLGDVTDQVKWLTTVGYIYLDADQYDKAEQSYKQALQMAQQTNKQDVIDALVSLALVSERRGKLDQARDYADKTIALVPDDGNRLDVLYPMLVKGHVAARQHDSRQAERIYREIEHDPKSHVFLKWEAEHSLAQLYEDENKPDAAEREYRAALNTFESARAVLHEDTSLPFPANAAGIYDDYIRFLVNRKKTDEALQIAEYQRGRTLAEGLGVLQKGATFKPEGLNTQSIARKVGGTILFYWLGEKQSHLWAITPQKITVFTLPPKSEIEAIAQRYRKALSEQQEFLQRTTDDGVALYHMLVEPVGNLLRPNAKVFIIPDGSLNTLNFETLLVPDSTPHYWIEDVTITDASSLRLLAASRTSPKHTDNVLLFGNAASPNSDYPELRKAASEMEIIEKHFQPKQQGVFAREQATPAAYLASKPEQYSYIHFVAHGTASRMSPLDSAIVLSRSNAQEDSFKLYARDIIHHPLRAQLVTISTCYGAGSRAYSGEGLVGLSWAFLRAGAHSVIGALWEVSDVSTPLLMDELYRELETGNTPDAALRNAKLTLLRSSNAFRKPFYWAPFQLYTGS